jgi:hypothetical protein
MITFLANLQNNNRQINVQSYIIKNKSFEIQKKVYYFHWGT